MEMWPWRQTNNRKVKIRLVSKSTKDCWTADFCNALFLTRGAHWVDWKNLYLSFQLNFVFLAISKHFGFIRDNIYILMSGRSEFDIWRLLVKRKVLFEESAVISPPCLYRFARSRQPGEWVWILRRDWTIIWIVLSNIKRCFKKDRERDDDRFVIVVALYVGQICRQPMSVEDEPSWSAVSPARHPLPTFLRNHSEVSLIFLP